MRLTTAQLVRERISFGDIEDANLAIDGALESATVQLEQLLRTEFAKTVRNDVFYVDTSVADASGSKNTKLFLTQGFVLASPALSVVTSPSRSGLATAPVSVTTFTAQREVGLVSIYEQDLDGGYVSVSYTAGFDVDSYDSGLYTGVPSWLQQAAVVTAISGLRLNPLFSTEGARLPEKAVMDAELSAVLSSHVRYRPAYRQPIEQN